MSSFGFAALLTAVLHPPSWRRMEAELDRRDSTLLRLGVILALEAALLITLTIHLSLPASG